MKLVSIETIPARNLRPWTSCKYRGGVQQKLRSHFMAGMKTLVGGDHRLHRDAGGARQIATKRMVDAAGGSGADAVVGLRYASASVMQGAAEVIAYGTAVSSNDARHLSGPQRLSGELPGLTLLFDWWKGDLPPAIRPLLVLLPAIAIQTTLIPGFLLWMTGSGMSDSFWQGHPSDRPEPENGTRKSRRGLPGAFRRESASPARRHRGRNVSTDEGVAFLVTAEGRTVFHAGDLNWWHWEGEDPV